MGQESLLKDVRFNLPIYGGGADVARGAFLRRGATPATNNGALIAATGASALPDILGQLQEMLDYSEDGETLIAGTSFVTKPVILAHPFRIFRIQYDTTGIQCTEAVSTTDMNVTSLEGDIDASFIYVQTGTGAGQLQFSTAAGSSDVTLKAAFTTALDTSSYFLKILPRFHQLISLTSDGTKLAHQAAAGAVTAIVIDTWISRNGRMEQLNPVTHAGLTGLNSLHSLKFYADVAFIDAIPYSIA